MGVLLRVRNVQALLLAATAAVMVSLLGQSAYPAGSSGSGATGLAAAGLGLLALLLIALVLGGDGVRRWGGKGARGSSSRRRSAGSLLPPLHSVLFPPTHHEKLHDRKYLRRMLRAEEQAREEQRRRARREARRQQHRQSGGGSGTHAGSDDDPSS